MLFINKRFYGDIFVVGDERLFHCNGFFLRFKVISLNQIVIRRTSTKIRVKHPMYEVVSKGYKSTYIELKKYLFTYVLYHFLDGFTRKKVYIWMHKNVDYEKALRILFIDMRLYGDIFGVGDESLFHFDKIFFTSMSYLEMQLLKVKPQKEEFSLSNRQ